MALRRCEGGTPLLDCRSGGGLVFEAEWQELQRASVQHRAVDLRYDSTGAEPRGAEALAGLASGLLERWWQVFILWPELFDLVLKGQRPALELQGLCYYGLVTALFLQAQYLSEVWGDGAGALKQLQLALNMLGVHYHLDFIRQASSWPFDALDLRLNREQLLRWLDQGDAESTPPAFSPAGGRLRVGPLAAVKTRTGRVQWSGPLALAVFGVHSTLMLEPVTMLRVALWPQRVRVRVFMRDCPTGNAVWGHHCMLQCRTLGECGAPEGSKQLFLELVHKFEDAIFGEGEYYRVADYLELLVEMYRMDEQLRAAALYVCTSPLVCSLLRAVFEKPLLAYLGMQLHVGVDRQRDQLWLMHFREMARSSNRGTRFAVHNFAMREQIHYATGVRLDVVRPRALYAHRGVPLSRLAHVHSSPLRTPAWPRRVLLFRSSYFQLSLFPQILQRQLAACGGGGYPLDFRLVSNATDFVEFAEIKRYGAAVLFPWDPALMAFYELYALGGPAVLLPDRTWAFKVQRLSGWIWSQPSGQLELAGLQSLNGTEAAQGRVAHEHSPWWKPQDSTPEQVLHWYAYSDYERLPHLVRFGGLAQLLQQLLRGRLLRHARRGMQRHNRQALRSGLKWYGGALAWLLGAASSHHDAVAF